MKHAQFVTYFVKSGSIKEYIERRHGEPFKFLFLPKMGLLGTLQMFTGIYGGPAGKLECGDFRIAGFTCISAFSINSVGVPFMDFAGKL